MPYNGTELHEDFLTIKEIKMELPKDLSWEITTNENGVEMITMPKFKMNEIVEYLKYADTELKKLRVADVIKNEAAVCPKCKVKSMVKYRDGKQCSFCLLTL